MYAIFVTQKKTVTFEYSVVLRVKLASPCTISSQFFEFWGKMAIYLKSVQCCICIGLMPDCPSMSVWLFLCSCVGTSVTHSRQRYYHHDNPTVTELVNNMDKTLLAAVVHNNKHVLFLYLARSS